MVYRGNLSTLFLLPCLLRTAVPQRLLPKRKAPGRYRNCTPRASFPDSRPFSINDRSETSPRNVDCLLNWLCALRKVLTKIRPTSSPFVPRSQIEPSCVIRSVTACSGVSMKCTPVMHVKVDFGRSLWIRFLLFLLFRLPSSD